MSPKRKPKKSEDNEAEIVAIDLIKANLVMLEEKAGLISKPTGIKHILRTAADYTMSYVKSVC